jgi:ATP phosphoribosyltransferase regulatory subunit
MTGNGAATPRPAAHEALLALFEDRGYARVEPPVLQPVEPFLELSGEDIRRRIFITQDGAGAELCLRPEYTIPVGRHHRAVADGQAADYSYLGPVFRLRAAEPDEFHQAGIESIGRTDVPAADAEILGLALDGLDRLGRRDRQVRLGDMGLITALLDALNVQPAAKRRTLRAVAAGRSLDEIATPVAVDAAHAGLLSAIQGQDPQGVRAFVEDVLAIAGISRVGGRTAGEIAERFLEQAALRSGAGVAAETRQVLDRFLSIESDPDDASRKLRSLADDAKLSLAPALDRFDQRLGFMAARGLDIATLAFSGRLIRNLDYYTGFVFETRDASQPDAPPLVGGGRYDRLLASLGAPTDVPAVGAALWADRRASGEAA